MPRVSLAASTPVAAQAGAQIADQGGNAVDAAVASAIVSMCSDVGVVGPTASGFLHIWPRAEEPVIIDAYAEVPGRGFALENPAPRGREIHMDYGGGARTLVGYETVAVPGAFLGLARASERFGVLPWHELLQPAIQRTSEGCPLPRSSAEYLQYSAEPVFGWHPCGRRVLQHPDGSPIQSGERLLIPGLSESLRQMASEGVECFYGGELGARIARDVTSNGGRLTLADLAAYDSVLREPLRIRFGDWEVALNPSPAVGGVTLGAMLLLLDKRPPSDWSPEACGRMIEIQSAVLDYRKRRLEHGEELDEAARSLLQHAGSGDLRALRSSPSTIHVSATDTNGLACAVTLSEGYGSGAFVEETGMWLNNALGELELHPTDQALPAPGTRLISNMAPTIARRDDGAVLAIGSSGSDRITTAIAQTLSNFILLGMPLNEAVDHPRLHVETFEGEARVAFEPGLGLGSPRELPHCGDQRVSPRTFAGLDMYFGAVQASLVDPAGRLTDAADPRRDGITMQGGS